MSSVFHIFFIIKRFIDHLGILFLKEKLSLKKALDYNLTNGDTATIAEIYSDGEILLDDGRTIPADFESISYGYATTSHKSQGSTCDHAILP